MHRQAASNTPPATISSIVVPQKPTLAQFEVMFEGTPLILERATDYWESGRVSSVQEIAPQLYHAQVSGSADDCYDVDIRLSKDAHGENANEANTDDQATTSSNSDHESTTDDNSIRIQSAACTCPYQRTPYCKHIGAVLYELRKQLIGAHGNHHNDDTANAHDGVIALPRTVLDPIQQHLDARRAGQRPSAVPVVHPTARSRKDILRPARRRTTANPADRRTNHALRHNPPMP